MKQSKPLSASALRKLGYYVYLYIRPDSGEVFYVGKGKGGRAFAHVDGKGETPHDLVIRELHQRGLEPQVEFLIHGLSSEKEALAVEMAAIDLLGLERLSNRVHGHHSRHQGRMSVDEIRAKYEQEEVEIIDPVVLIRINRLYHYGMSPVELYDATRSCWKVSQRHDRAQYALAVFEGVMREVYRIAAWLPAGSTFRHDYPQGTQPSARFEFVGAVAETVVRQRYLHRSVSGYWSKGAQNPIRFVGC